MGEGRGVFTFFTALSHWPDRALVGGRKHRGEKRGNAG